MHLRLYEMSVDEVEAGKEVLVKSIPPNTENSMQYGYDENDSNNMSNETKRETNYSINNNNTRYMPDETSWDVMQQVRPRHEEPLLDGNAHSVRYGEMIHDVSGNLRKLIPKKVQFPKLSSWEVTQQNL